ncbi:MAG: glycosyltransferase family 39 protein [Flavobacteriaceae bacterium]|nr:glycosyltransferase family 39 protein [Flavobacteriaceae bacterium]
MHRRNLILFLVIVMITLLSTAGLYGVMESSDARYAEIGREMYNSGDLLHPDLLDVHHYHKPPLTYIITTLGYQLFGSTPFGARFFLQLALLLQLLLVYKLTLLLFDNRKTALWAAVIYFGFPIVLISSRNLTTDAYLTTFVLASLVSWVVYRKQGRSRWLYVFMLALGLGFLTKGPVVFIVPLPFILLYNRIEKAKNNISYHHFFAWMLFLVIAATWFVYLVIEDRQFLDYFLGKQTVDRFSENAFDRTEPFWYFLAFGPLVGLPWFLILIYLIKLNWKHFSKRSIYSVFLITGIIVLMFFSISSSKRILYILPLYSLLAVLSAQLLAVSSERTRKKILLMVTAFLALIAIAFVVVSFIKIDFDIPVFLPLSGVLVLVIAFAVVRSVPVKNCDKAILLTFLTGILLLLGSSLFFSRNELQVNASAPVTRFIIENQLNNREVLVYNTRKSSIAFGLNKSIVSLNNGDKSLARETQFETDDNWRKYLIDLRKAEEVNYLKSVLAKPTVLLVYKYPVDEKNQWLLSYYTNKKEMGKWTIYY